MIFQKMKLIISQIWTFLGDDYSNNDDDDDDDSVIEMMISMVDVVDDYENGCIDDDWNYDEHGYVDLVDDNNNVNSDNNDDEHDGVFSIIKII